MAPKFTTRKGKGGRVVHDYGKRTVTSGKGGFKAPKPKAPAPAPVSPLLDPTAVLAGAPLQRAAQQVTDLQYKPQLSALDTQATNTRTQYGGVAAKANDYYKGLAADEAEGIARQQALGDWLKTAQAGVGTATQGAFHDMSAGEAQRESQDASVRGAGLGGGSGDAVANTIAATQGRAATLQQGAANAGVEQASDWANLANAISAAHTLRGTEQQGQITNREMNTLGSLADKRTALEGERAAAGTKNLLDLRQQGFTNLATTQGLGLDQAKLAQAGDIAARSDKTRRAGQASTAATATANRTSREATAAAGRTAAEKRAAAAQKRQDAKDAAAERKRVQGVRTAAGKAWGPFETAKAQIDSGYRVPTLDVKGKDTGKTRAGTTSETEAALRSAKTPEWAIQAAVSIKHHGFIIPSVVDLIHRTAPDVRIPRQYLTRPARKPRAPAAGPAGPLAG